MIYKVFVLLGMVFAHIVDDYYLQGWLASAKQKDWWKKNCPDSMYDWDYIVALFMHSFSWAFDVMLVPTLYRMVHNNCDLRLLWFFIGNMVVHMIVDHLKANIKAINLVEDQLLHMAQIFLTWTVLIA